MMTTKFELPATMRIRIPKGLSESQVQGIIAMTACQVRQTGWVPEGKRRRATPQERSWAEQVDDFRQIAEMASRVSGSCHGCNRNPCQCVA